jgi:proteic killer suppression protein
LDIFFKNSKLQRVCNSGALLQKNYGTENSKRIRVRLAVLAAATSLADVPVKLPERCHPLTGPRAGCFAIDLLHPFRLVFCPADAGGRRVAGAQPRLRTVLAILVLEIVDYH